MKEDDKPISFEEGLLQYIPEWQQVFYGTYSYNELVKALRNLSDNPSDENTNAFIHARMIWEEFCLKDPEAVAAKANIEQTKKQEIKNKKYKSLYEIHKEKILSDL